MARTQEVPKRYKYKGIILFQSCGLWNADYTYGGARWALHRAGTSTKKRAYEIAKDNVDYLNRLDRLERRTGV